MWYYKLGANATLIAHVAYVSFVILGLLAIWAGIVFRWRWVRNRWFRSINLTMIAIVVVESWLGIVCPLTTLENWFRKQSGQSLYDGDFIEIWLHDLIFFRGPPWLFACGYTVFGIAVIGTLWLAPPAWRRNPQVIPPQADRTS